MIERWLLGRLRFPFGLGWLDIRTGPGGTGLATAVFDFGWRPPDTVLQPASRIARSAIVVVAFLMGLFLGFIFAHSRVGCLSACAPLLGAWFVFTILFVNASCGPIVRVSPEGLIVESVSEGRHFVPWLSVHAWTRADPFLLVDLGPQTPLASRYLCIPPRRAARRGNGGDL